MYPLLIRPIPKEDESPASVLIRAAQSNGYETVSEMISVTKQDHQISISTLTLLVDCLARYLRLTTALCLRCVRPEEVLEREGTARSRRRFFANFYPAEFFRQDGINYCPGCLHEAGYLRKIWMFKPYAVCHLHNLLLRSTCHICDEKLKLYRGKVSVCSQCDAELGQASSINNGGRVSTWVSQFVNTAEQSAVDDFISFFEWAKSIHGKDHKLKSDAEAAEFTCSYFESNTIVEAHLLEYVAYDNRHLKLLLLPLLKSTPDIRLQARNILDRHSQQKPFSEMDLKTRLTLTDASLVLDISPTTMRKLLMRNDARASEREPLVFLSELLKVIDTDVIRKNNLKVASQEDILTINEVAEQLNVHPEIVRSVQKSNFMVFERRRITGSLKYITQQSSVDRFSEEFALVGSIARQFGVNATDLTARLGALDIFPIATPKNSNLKTCLFKVADLKDLTTKEILAVTKCSTNAGRKRSGEQRVEPPQKGIRIVEVADRLNLSVQKVKTLISENLLEKEAGIQNGVCVQNASLYELEGLLKNPDYIPLDEAVKILGITKTILLREWVSAGVVEYCNLKYWQLVNEKDIYKVVDIYKEYLNGPEASALLGMPRHHVANLFKRGLIKRQSFGANDRISLYKISDVLSHKSI